MSSEELRRSVFSSVHMSSLVKTTHASITYPSCSFCGGCAINSKSSPKRKVALCQVSLYSNLSDSFIVWYKKQEEPKGMLWLHSCLIRRGDNCVELISRGCRGRCSYTLKLSSVSANEEWYRSLKLESRKTSTVGDDFTNESVDGQGSCSDLTSLDSMLTDISPLSSINELSNYSDSDENSDDGSVISTTPVAPSTNSKSKSKKKSRSNPSKVKVKSVFSNPFHGLGRSRKTSQPTLSSSVSISTAPLALESIENSNQPTPDADHWGRWS